MSYKGRTILKADKAYMCRFGFFISETYQTHTSPDFQVFAAHMWDFYPTFPVNNYLRSPYRSPAHSITQVSEIHTGIPPLKGFGPAVGSSLIPGHTAAAASMDLHDLARPRLESSAPH